MTEEGVMVRGSHDADRSGTVNGYSSVGEAEGMWEGVASNGTYTTCIVRV